MAVDRKEQILAAAYEIVGVEGLEGLHARSVAAKVGINHAAVHYYYPKRSDLLAATAAYAISRFQADRAKISANAATPTERIEAQLALIEAYSKPNSRFAKNWVSLFVAAISDETVRGLLAQHLSEWIESLQVEIASGLRRREVHNTSPFADSGLFVATLLGAMLVAQTMGSDYNITEKFDVVAGSLLA